MRLKILHLFSHRPGPKIAGPYDDFRKRSIRLKYGCIIARVFVIIGSLGHCLF